MASRNTVRKKQYTLLWSALLWTSFSFWIHRFQFSLRMGLRCARFAGADALLKRRKSGKDKKYLCKLENTDKSIFFSVKPNFKRDIQDIFHRLLHFHERQMDQRLGFSVTELSFNFEVWWMGTISFSFEKYLYMVCLKMAHLGRVTYCFETLLFLCKLVFFNYNFHKNTRLKQKRFVSKLGQPRLYTQLKARLLTEQLKLHYSVHYCRLAILPIAVCKICFSIANMRNTPLALSLFIRLLFYLTQIQNKQNK